MGAPVGREAPRPEEGLEGRPLLECLGERYMEKYSDPVLRSLMLHTLSVEEIYEPIRDEAKKICSSYTRQIAQRAYGRSGPPRGSG